MVVVGHGAERVTKKVQEQAPAWANVTFVEQTAQRGTGDAAAGRHDRVPRRRPRRRLDRRRAARRHAAAAPRDARRARRRARRQRQRRHRCSPASLDDPTGLRAGGPRPPDGAGAAHRRAARRQPRRARHQRGRHEHLRLPPRPARAGAAPPLARQRPGRVLPHRRRRRARRHGPPHRLRAGARRARPRASTTAGSWPSPSASCGRRTNRHWLLNGVTMLDPRQTFIDVTVRLGRDVTLYPGTILQGNTVIGDGCEIGPDTRLVDCVVGRDCLVQHTVGVEAEIGDRRRVGPYAHLPPGRRSLRASTTGAFYTATHGLRRERETPMEKVTTKGWRSTRVAPTPRWPRRSPSTSASSSATRTSSSSPTARCGRGSPRASAATTCSSCRPTSASTAVDQRLDHGAADHDRRRLPGVGEADHRGLPVLRLRPPGPQGRGPRADHRPPRRRPVQGRRRQADGLDRPPQRPDPGLLRRSGRPPHGDAGARGLPPRARSRRR